jgi:hypothetical protein
MAGTAWFGHQLHLRPAHVVNPTMLQCKMIRSDRYFASNKGKRKLRNERAVAALTMSGSWKEVIMRSFVIGALVVAVAVLGYLYWDSQHNTLVMLPGVEIKKN